MCITSYRIAIAIAEKFGDSGESSCMIRQAKTIQTCTYMLLTDLFIRQTLEES